jgi:hypothetical protein
MRCYALASYEFTICCRTRPTEAEVLGLCAEFKLETAKRLSHASYFERAIPPAIIPLGAFYSTGVR